MKAVSLFTGAGGFDLAMERAGIETVLQCDLFDASHLTELPEHERRALTAYGRNLEGVLARHWPGVERVNDVRAVSVGHGAGDGTAEPPEPGAGDHADAQWGGATVDLVFGGSPCQDVSVAGKRAGLGGARSGLFFEFVRVVRELRPRWVVFENVPGLLSSNQGRDFGVVLDELGQCGFGGLAWAILDAQHFGVPQRRRRVFVVAGPTRHGVEQVLSLCESCGGNPETGGAAREGTAVAPALRASGVGTERIGDTRGQDPLVVSRAALEAQADALDHIFGEPPQTASAVTASAGHHGHSSPRGDGSDNLIPAMSIRTAQTGSNGWGVGTDEQAYTLDGAQGQAVIHPALRVRDGKGIGFDYEDGRLIAPVSGVRRLTPLECERLQGWPDDFTRWTADGREVPDSHRYRMAGNGVASPVAEWIAHRLVAIDRQETVGG